MLLIALSTHAIFEGIALGLTQELPAVINIMIALVLHKTAASMSLGISLSKAFNSQEEKSHALFLLIVFALATPIGIGIGTLLSDTKTIVEIVFSSFAGGTFIYLAASEVIVEEFGNSKDRWKKMLTYLMGGSIITLLWLMEVD